jgi:hypothetical protein
LTARYRIDHDKPRVGKSARVFAERTQRAEFADRQNMRTQPEKDR